MQQGILERVLRIADHLAGLMGNRMALFSLEAQEEIERLLGHVALLFGFVAFAALSLLVLTAAVLVVAARHDFLLGAALLLGAGYGLVALGIGYCLLGRLRRGQQPFAATRAEFERDHRALRRQPEGEA